MLKQLCCVVFVSGFLSQAGAGPVAQVAPGTVLTDGQIAEVLLTANEGEADVGKVGRDKTKNAQVKSFAEMMINEHEANTKEVKKVVKAHDIDTDDSSLSKSLEDEASKTKKDLKGQKPADFDRAFVGHQVTMHEKVLATLKETLIPQAKNPEFRALLEKTRDAVAKHLAHAKDLQTKL